jgi:hypothetical protein
MDNDHYETAAEYLTALMAARGLEPSEEDSTITAVGQWCRKHIKKAPESSPALVRQHKRFAKKVFATAIADMGDFCIKARALGRLDQGRLNYHIPPASQVWSMIQGADEGVQELVRMRTNTPAMAEALEWSMSQMEAGARMGAQGMARRGADVDLGRVYVPDNELTPEQLQKRQQNRQSRLEKKVRTHPDRDGHKYKQLQLDGTRTVTFDPDNRKGGRGRGNKRKGEGDGGSGRGNKKQKGGKKGRGRGRGGGKMTAFWDNDPKTVTVDDIVFDTRDADGKKVSEVLGIPDPVCFGWCVKAGACSQPWHHDHQGEDAAAHRNITADHRDIFCAHFRRE